MKRILICIETPEENSIENSFPSESSDEEVEEQKINQRTGE